VDPDPHPDPYQNVMDPQHLDLHPKQMWYRYHCSLQNEVYATFGSTIRGGEGGGVRLNARQTTQLGRLDTRLDTTVSLSLMTQYKFLVHFFLLKS
jgi:hypothetical protein